MVKGHFGKRKWLILITAIVLAVVLPLASFQLLISSHMYPQDAIQAISNLSVEGTITSIENNHRIDGLMAGSYHIFQSYIRLNITGVLWIDDDLADWVTVDYENNTVNGWETIGIGYDNLDNIQLAVGQTVECKGYYVAHTDTPYSYIITVSPSISESYLEKQTELATTKGLVSTANQAIEIAMPIVELYAKENNRTITSMVDATLSYDDSMPIWLVDVEFEAIKSLAEEPWRDLQFWIDVYQVSIWADTGEIRYHDVKRHY